MKKSSLIFTAWIALFFVVSPLSAQVSLGQFYDLDSFSMPDPVSAPRNHVAIDARYFGKHLVLEVQIAEDWHLYSVTQPDGGTIRSEFHFESPPNSDLNADLLEIRPSQVPHVESNVPGFNVDIESHEDAVTWIFTFKKDLPSDGPISGQLEGQVCQSGEGGVCIPITVSFKAVYDPDLDIPVAMDIPDRFVQKRDGDVKSPQVSQEFTPQEFTQVTGFATALFYAFLGGIILNFMPCVLPVIGLKILSFFEQAGKSRAKAFYLNVWYSLGLMSVFMLLAFLSYGLSILFTFDLFNIIMVCVVFAMALSLMDVWELSVPSFLGTGTSVKLTQQEGVVGAFFKGIITTLLAIPCGAPLLSPAVNWADMQIRSGNTPLVFVAYGMIGLGMASPYLLIGAFPELLRFLPKPGQWMETFKKTMGFFLLVAVVWILYFVQLERILPTIALLFALWFACWMVGRLGYTAKPKQRFTAWTVSLVVVLFTVFFSFEIPGVPNSYNLETAMKNRFYGSQNEHWKPYTPEVFESALASGKPVMVDFTADWCVNCKVLEATVLHSDAVLKAIEDKKIVSLVGDCTKEGDAKKFLRRFGADQVPVLAIFDPKNPSQPIVLRGGYTQKTLLDILDKLP